MVRSVYANTQQSAGLARQRCEYRLLVWQLVPTSSLSTKAYIRHTPWPELRHSRHSYYEIRHCRLLRGCFGLISAPTHGSGRSTHFPGKGKQLLLYETLVSISSFARAHTHITHHTPPNPSLLFFLRGSGEDPYLRANGSVPIVSSWRSRSSRSAWTRGVGAGVVPEIAQYPRQAEGLGKRVQLRILEIVFGARQRNINKSCGMFYERRICRGRDHRDGRATYRVSH